MTSATARIVQAAPTFAALGDETRLEILVRLSTRGPQSIVALTEQAQVSRQAVTKHLVTLEEVGLVSSSREGRERIWEIEPRRLADARRLLDRISGQWDEALERLRHAVEDVESE